MDRIITPQIKASIDIGTNTVLLLVAKVGDQNLEVLHEAYRMPRLGKGVDENRTLHADSIARVLEVLTEYKSVLDAKFPECKDVIVTATSAVRDAQNRDQFIEAVNQKTGFEITLLSGDEEAQCTYRGALATLDQANTQQSNIVLDIGGGSTEIAVGNGNTLEAYTSVDIGCVRFTERFLSQNPPNKESISACRLAIREALTNQSLDSAEHTTAIGVAGTMTSLAAIDLQLDAPQINQLNGHIISRTTISRNIEVFSTQTYDQLLKLNPSVLNGREDIFLAGLLILDEFLNFYSLNEIKTSTGGIRHGAILKG
jgi:exopolyphosphatase/guanosine-5'-triphosphate,3'-diphosphate pyrophosphatase